MVLTYKCRGCGAHMVYDIASRALKCRTCGNAESIEQAEAANPVAQRDEPQAFTCPSCGAPIDAGKDGASLYCGYCSSPVVLTPRLTGRFTPKYIIPFAFGLEDAEKKFRKWCKNGLITPSSLMREQKLGHMIGEYVPFWLYSMSTNTKLSAHCTKTHIYRLGDNEYTEISHFDVSRDIDLSFQKVPADASERMNDQLMDLLEPYNYNSLSDFHMPVLSGFFAERYNYDQNELYARVKARIDRYCSDFVRSQIHGYGSVMITSSNTTDIASDGEFALLPVYTLRYTFKGKDFLFAMNGQTGRISGKPPISWGKAALWFAGLTAGIYLLIRLVSLIL